MWDGEHESPGETMDELNGSALLLVDVQQGLDDPVWGRRNNPEAERNIAALLSAWRTVGWPVIHVQHMSRRPTSPLRPGQPGNAFKPEAQPREGEPVYTKTVNSAFIGTELEEYLRCEGIERIVVVGLTTDHCVSTTARMGANLGFDVTVVGDATATFDRVGPDGAVYTAEQMHGAALASLHGEFARVVTSDEVLGRAGAKAEP